MKTRLSKVVQLVLLSSLLTAMGCGDDGDTVNVTIDDPGNRAQQEQDPGNNNPDSVKIINKNIVKNNFQTRNKFVQRGDTFITRIVVNNTTNSVVHQQYIHVGNRCPIPADDLNGDGFIDEVETQQVVGKALISLDSDLENQDQGKFPVANSSGHYSYQRSVSISRLLSDLRAPETGEDQRFTKLQVGEELNLSERVLVVYGVSRNTELPETFATLEDSPQHQSVPIYCQRLDVQQGTSINQADPANETSEDDDLVDRAEDIIEEVADQI